MKLETAIRELEDLKERIFALERNFPIEDDYVIVPLKMARAGLGMALSRSIALLHKREK